MSLHYELVVAIYLRRDLGAAGLAEARWHCGLGPRPADLVIDEPLLPAGDSGYLPGGEITRISEAARSEGRTWGLFVRRYMLDDGFYELLTPLCRWLAAVADDGYAGFWREVDRLTPNVLVVRNGHAYTSGEDGEWGPATEGAPPWPGTVTRG